jgi:hypothetical protein
LNSKINKQSSKMNKQQQSECQTIQWGKQSSKVNVRQYNEVNNGVKWMSDNTMGKQSSFTALFTSLYCLTFIVLLFIHFTALFIYFTALFIHW